MSTSKTDAWMPLWIGAYLADTQHLIRDEHGGYLLLIMAYWRTASPLPDDDKRLAAIAKATPKEWKSLRPTLAEFFQVADGFWSHKRIDQELAEAGHKKAKAKSKAQAGGGIRWDSDSDSEKRGRDLRSSRIAEARKKGTHTAIEWELMKAFHDARCVRCGSDGEIVKDHVKPIYQGGSDSIDNIQPLCRKCNASKGADSSDLRKEGWKNVLMNAFNEGNKEGIKCLPNAFPTPSPIKPSINLPANAVEPGKFPMRIGWQPSEHVAGLAKQSGTPLLDSDLPEFVAHWLTQPITQRTQAEWDKALLQSAKHRDLRAKSPLSARGKSAPKTENFHEKDYGTEIRPL